MSSSLPSTNCPRFRPQPPLSLRASIAFGNANISRVLVDWIHDWIAVRLSRLKSRRMLDIYCTPNFPSSTQRNLHSWPSQAFFSLALGLCSFPAVSFLPSVRRSLKEIIAGKVAPSMSNCVMKPSFIFGNGPGAPKARRTRHVACSKMLLGRFSLFLPLSNQVESLFFPVRTRTYLLGVPLKVLFEVKPFCDGTIKPFQGPGCHVATFRLLLIRQLLISRQLMVGRWRS